MRRLLLVGLLGCAGCLEPGEPVLAARDTTPPNVVSTKPGAGGTVLAGASLEVVFSETMDARTLRPGIAIFEGRVELPLVLTVPPGSDAGENVEYGDVPYTVTVSAESGALKPGTAYTLVLRNSLTDSEGNPLRQEVRVPFRTEP